jgi:hypothetical protein
LIRAFSLKRLDQSAQTRDQTGFDQIDLGNSLVNGPNPGKEVEKKMRNPQEQETSRHGILEGHNLNREIIWV